MNMEYFESLVVRINRNELDHFEVVTEGGKFGIDYSNAKDFSEEKYLLLHAVLQEILKTSESSKIEKYEKMLETTNKFLLLCSSTRSEKKGYPCSFPGCLFRSKRHRDFVRHLKSVHSTAESFVCSYMRKCKRHFSEISALIDHVKSTHTQQTQDKSGPESSRSSDVIQTSCKCNMVSCGGKVFKSSWDLSLHFTKDHKKEPRECIFSNCSTRFTHKSIPRNHFRLKHFNIGKTKLKDVHLISEFANLLPQHEHLDQDIDTQSLDTLSELHVDTYDYDDVEETESEDDNETDPENEEEQNNDEKHFVMAYADFLNRMINYKFVPISTVHEIAAEFFQQASQSAQSRESQLRESLKKVPNISEQLLEEIVRDSLQDPLLKAQEQLSSEHKRSKFMEDNFKLIKPREIVLNSEEVKHGAKKEVIHYVPILASFKTLIEDTSFICAMENARNNERRNSKENLIEDVKDGSAYRNNEYFVNNPEAFSLMMYSDGVELTNPLSSGKGKHKIVQVFWQVCDTPRFQRSSVDRLQLGLVFKEKHLRKHKYSKIFKCLVDDLILLERDGVEITEPIPRRVKAGLLLYSGDNLESHMVGGFSASFSSKDVCRHCRIQYNNLQENIHNFDGDAIHQPWTVAEYDGHKLREEENDEVDDQSDISIEDSDLFTEFEEPVERDSSDDTEEEVETGTPVQHDYNYGIKWKCAFNVLKSFHCVTSMPVDSMHDLMEGVIPQDLLGILRLLILNGWFTLEEYNLALKNLKYSHQESSNKPQEVPSSPRIKKLSGKAVSNWVHIRNFPLILYLKGWVLDENDSIFQLAMKLHELTERLTAEIFRPHEVWVLEDVIIEYLDFRKAVFDEYPVIGRAKPKHHFLVHYPSFISKFGPSSGYWTARYESKHRVAKSTAESSKNFINISKTISHRQQNRLCSVYYHGMFSCEKFKLPTKVKTKEDLNDETEVDKNLKEFMTSGSDLVCSEIDFQCRKYKIGDVVVLKRNDRLKIEVGLVKAFLVRRRKVYLIIRRYILEQNYLRLFESISFSNDLGFVNIEALQDSYPLCKRGTEEKFIIVPHHHISFSYD